MSSRTQFSETGWNVPDLFTGHSAMAARPRIRRRANWPENMHEPRPGYFTWRNPITKKTLVIGYVPVEQAIFEVLEANAKAKEITPTKTLALRMDQGAETIADLLEKMPTKGVKPSTIEYRKYRDRFIKKELGDIKCVDLTTKHVADMLEKIEEQGKMQWAVQIRNRLRTICRRGKALGWMKENPVTDTERTKVEVKRRRLRGIEEFNAIFEKAPLVSDWLQNAMLLALVSGQDRSTIARWERSFVQGDVALVQRSKTSVKIEIPLVLRLDVLGMSLEDVIVRCRSTGVVSKYLIHHIRNQGRAVRGSHVKLGSISNAFAEARELAGIIGDDAPTFHEIRSLAKRLYDAQGNVDTKALLGHMTEAMSEMYADSRGIAPLKVTIGKQGFEHLLNNR